MPYTVWKYELRLTPRQQVSLDAGLVHLLSVQMQADKLMLWAEVEPTEDSRNLDSIEIVIVGTGEECPATDFDYLATVQQHEFVWHFFWRFVGDYSTPSEWVRPASEMRRYGG